MQAPFYIGQFATSVVLHLEDFIFHITSRRLDDSHIIDLFTDEATSDR